MGRPPSWARPSAAALLDAGVPPSWTVASSAGSVSAAGTEGRSLPTPAPTERAAPVQDPPPDVVLPPAKRLRLALGERLPAWAGARCGMEPRTLAALALLLLVAAGFAVHHFWTGRPQPVSLAEPATATSSPTAAVALPSASATGDAAGSLVVDVSGDVREPGVYTLPAGSRVADALDAAGGAEPAADTETLNRARLLVDGEQIVVGAPAAVASAPVATAGDPSTTALLSLNSASPEQLEELPGIGPVLAANIVDYREQSGGFTTVEELLDVSGIGESRLAELRDHVTL